MIRKAAVFLSTFLLLVSAQVSAVGLGNVLLESSLNQPLRGRIEILDLGTVAPADISVQLASPEDFNRFNVERNGFLLNLQLRVEETSNGVFVIISTTQPVREPFLTFILDTRWSSGRILSEHTVLLDLPAFDDNGSLQEPINQPVAQTPSPAQGVSQQSTSNTQAQSPTAIDTAGSPTPAPEPEPAPVSQQPAGGIATSVTPLPGTIETQSSDTLWEIAMRVRPNDSVSVQQTMLAIQRLNPDAFVDGNINRLRAGEVLRVPDLSDIQSVNQQQAVSEVSRQNQQADVQPLAAPAAAPAGSTSDGQGRLSVVTADDAEDDQATSGAATAADDAVLDSRLQALESQLALSQENADRARIEQQDLLQRLDDLEAQIASAMEIISLQDLQLAQLQESLAQAEVAAAEQQQAVTEPQQVTETAASLEAAPDTAASQPPAGLWQRFADIASNTSLLLIGAVILVVLLLVMFLLRRAKSSAVDVEDDIDIGEEEDDEFTAELDRSLAEEESSDELVTETADIDDEVDEILGLTDSEDEAKGASDAAVEEALDADEELDLDLPHFDDDADFEAADDAESEVEPEAQEEDEPLVAVQEDDAEALDIDASDDDIEEFDDLSGAEETDEDLGVTFDLADDEVEESTETEAVQDDDNALEFDGAGDLNLDDDESDDLEATEQTDLDQDSPDEELSTLDLDITDIKSTGTQQEPEPVKDTTSIDFEEEQAASEDDEAVVDFELEDFDADEPETGAVADKESAESEKADTEISSGLDFDLSDLGIDDGDEAVGKDQETIDLAEFAEAEDEVTATSDDGSGAASASTDDQEVESIDMNDLDFLAAENDAIPENEDEDFDFLSDDDEAATKLDLAYAYQKMGDVDGAREILEEVISEGNDAQKSEAKNLLETIEEK